MALFFTTETGGSFYFCCYLEKKEIAAVEMGAGKQILAMPAEKGVARMEGERQKVKR